MRNSEEAITCNIFDSSKKNECRLTKRARRATTCLNINFDVINYTGLHLFPGLKISEAHI